MGSLLIRPDVSGVHMCSVAPGLHACQHPAYAASPTIIDVKTPKIAALMPSAVTTRDWVSFSEPSLLPLTTTQSRFPCEPASGTRARVISENARRRGGSRSWRRLLTPARSDRVQTARADHPTRGSRSVAAPRRSRDRLARAKTASQPLSAFRMPKGSGPGRGYSRQQNRKRRLDAGPSPCVGRRSPPGGRVLALPHIRRASTVRPRAG